MVRPLETPGGLNTHEDNSRFLLTGDEALPDEAPVATGGDQNTPPPAGSSETVSNLPTGVNTTPIGRPPAQTQQAVGGPTLQQRTQKIQRGGQDLLTQYQQAAGPSRTYESTGAANILGETMDAGTMYGGATQQQIEQSQGFTGANYEGPMDLEQGAYQSLLGETRDARRAGSEALTGRGQIADIRSRNLGIGYGIARDEAYKRLKDPVLTGQSYEDLSMVGDASRNLESRRQEAESIGKERTAQEADIREQSRALVEGDQKLIADDIQDQMRAFDEVEAADRAAYLALREGGTSNVEAEVLDKFNMPEQTLGNRLVEEAHAEISKLRDKYDAIKDIPLMTVGQTHRGRNRKHVVIDGQKVDVFYDLEGVVGPEIKNMVEERQLELEELFGAFEGNKQTPGHKSWGTGTGYKSEGGFRPDEERGSPYRAVGDLFKGTPDKNNSVSLYGTGGLTMEEFADSIYKPMSVTDPAYMSWDPGVQATRGNVASDDQARRYNTIEEMLSQSGNEIIRDKTLSPQGGTVKFDREGLEAKEKSELTRMLDAKEKMEDARQASRGARRKGRKEELESGDLFGSLFDFGTSVATMDMEGGLEGPGRIFENTKSSIESTADKSKGAGDDIRSGKTAKSVANKTRDVAERTGKKTEEVIKKVPGIEPVRKGVKKGAKKTEKGIKKVPGVESTRKVSKKVASKGTKAGSSAASRSVDMGSNQRRRLKKKKKKKFYEELLKKTSK